MANQLYALLVGVDRYANPAQAPHLRHDAPIRAGLPAERDPVDDVQGKAANERAVQHVQIGTLVANVGNEDRVTRRDQDGARPAAELTGTTSGSADRPLVLPVWGEHLEVLSQLVEHDDSPVTGYGDAPTLR